MGSAKAFCMYPQTINSGDGSDAWIKESDIKINESTISSDGKSAQLKFSRLTYEIESFYSLDLEPEKQYAVYVSYFLGGQDDDDSATLSTASNNVKIFGGE